MKLTKLGHACLLLEKAGSSLLIDPGNLTESFSIADNIQAILITHAHPDHLDVSKLGDILAINPTAKIYGHQDVLQGLDEAIDPTHLVSVAVGDKLAIAEFRVEFSGGRHAVIHPDIPVINNLGLIIDQGDFFYPGDCLEVPATRVKTLALPASAPWMKIGETLDYQAKVQPNLVIPVHDAILSEAGRQIIDRLLITGASKLEIDYRRIDGQDGVEI